MKTQTKSAQCGFALSKTLKNYQIIFFNKYKVYKETGDQSKIKKGCDSPSTPRKIGHPNPRKLKMQ